MGNNPKDSVMVPVISKRRPSKMVEKPQEGRVVQVMPCRAARCLPPISICHRYYEDLHKRGIQLYAL